MFGNKKFSLGGSKKKPKKEGSEVQIPVPITVITGGAGTKPVTTTPNAQPSGKALVKPGGKEHYAWCVCADCKKMKGLDKKSTPKPASTAPKPYKAPPPPDPNVLACYFEERGPGMWWYGVEDKHGDKEHPYDHYGIFDTFGDAYEHMHKHFWGKKPGVTDFAIYPQSESHDDSWKSHEDKKKGFVK